MNPRMSLSHSHLIQKLRNIIGEREEGKVQGVW